MKKESVKNKKHRKKNNFLKIFLMSGMLACFKPYPLGCARIPEHPKIPNKLRNFLILFIFVILLLITTALIPVIGAVQSGYGCQFQCAVGAKGCDANAANRLACEMQPDGCRGWNSYPCQYGCNRGTGLCNPPPQPCVPQSCSSLGRKCGPDNCGTPDACGKCTLPKTCNSNGQCVCIPNCGTKKCGPDNCGTLNGCGTCQSPLTCDSQGNCVNTCGNKKVEGTEECDPGKNCVYPYPDGYGGYIYSNPLEDCTNLDLCAAHFTIPAGPPGSGFQAISAVCKLVNTNDCTAQCKYTFCGDGIIQWPNHNKQNEECDNQRGTDPAACHTQTALNNVYCVNENYPKDKNPYLDKNRVDWCTNQCKNPVPTCQTICYLTSPPGVTPLFANDEFFIGKSCPSCCPKYSQITSNYYEVDPNWDAALANNGYVSVSNGGIVVSLA